MEKIFFSLGDNIPQLEGGSLLLGYFDGVHLGHQELIKKAKSLTKKTGVLLFDKNLASLLPNTGKSLKELTSLEDKLDLFERFGIDSAYIIHTNLSFLSLSKEEFVQKVLQKISPSYLVVGEDYSFGRGKEGKVEYLKNFFHVSVCPLLEDRYGKISSRTIVSFLEEGKIKEANSELGYLYSLKGKVVPGLRNGRKISFPTANLEENDSYVIPKRGVYAGYTWVENKKYPSIINIGNNPTIGLLHHDLIESHLLSFEQDIYGKVIKIEFLDFLREEKKFSSLEELKEQLKKDKAFFDKK